MKTKIRYKVSKEYDEGYIIHRFINNYKDEGFLCKISNSTQFPHFIDIKNIVYSDAMFICKCLNNPSIYKIKKPLKENKQNANRSKKT